MKNIFKIVVLPEPDSPFKRVAAKFDGAYYVYLATPSISDSDAKNSLIDFLIKHLEELRNEKS